MPLDFKTSDPLTVGVELELMVLNTRDHDLTRGAPDLLARLAKAGLPSEVKPEITESMIEVSSDVHTRYGALLEQLQKIRDALVAGGDRLNVAVCGGSWLTPQEAVDAGDWARITRLAREASALRA